MTPDTPGYTGGHNWPRFIVNTIGSVGVAYLGKTDIEGLISEMRSALMLGRIQVHLVLLSLNRSFEIYGAYHICANGSHKHTEFV